MHCRGTSVPINFAHTYFLMEATVPPSSDAPKAATEQPCGAQNQSEESEAHQNIKRGDSGDFDKCSFFSKIFFCWPSSVIGFLSKNQFKIERLPKLSKYLEAQRTSSRLSQLLDGCETLTVFRLWVCAIRLSLFDHGILCLGHIASTIFKIISLHYNSKIVDQLTSAKIKCSDYDILLNILLLSVSLVASTLTSHFAFFMGTVAGCKTRSAFTTYLYERILGMKISSKITSGKLVNFVSNDLQRFEFVFPILHYLYLGIIEAVIIFFLLYQDLRSIALATVLTIALPIVLSVCTLIVILVIQYFLGWRMGKLLDVICDVRDNLVRTISDTISGIFVIKCFNWESVFTSEVIKQRDQLYDLLRRYNFLEALNIALYCISPALVSFVAIACFVQTNRQFLTEAVVTSVYSMFSYSAQSVSYFMPVAFTGVIQVNLTFRRFIEIMEEIDFGEMPQVERSIQEADPICLKFDSVSVSWDAEASSEASATPPSACSGDPLISCVSVAAQELCLQNVSLSIDKGEFVAVIGSVGAGKTSLLLTIMDELNIVSGKLQLCSCESITYAPQKSWLLSGTIRENILLGRHFDQPFYERILAVCCLERDLATFPEGDAKYVGENGSSLSGGQKARICLARALYERNCTVYLLDDVFSSVDNKVGNILFRNLTNFLQSAAEPASLKTCILVTHQLQYLKYFDRIIVVKCGEIDFFGTFSNLLRSECDIVSALEEYNQLSDEDEEPNADVGFEPGVSQADLSLVSVDTMVDTGAIGQKILPNPSQSASHTVREALRSSRVTASSNAVESNLVFSTTEEKMEVGAVSLSTYKQFFKASNLSHYRLVFIVLIAIFAEACLTLVKWLLFGWPARSSGSAGSDTAYQATLLALMFGALVVLYFRVSIFIGQCSASANSVFRKVVQSVIGAEMRFFLENPQGRILNRFANDQSIIDEYIASDMYDTFQCFISAIGLLIVIVSSSKYILFCILPICLPAELVRRRYITAARQIKRFECVMRSPVYSLLSSSLEGLVVIRCMQQRQTFVSLFCRYLDNNSRACFASFGVANWLGVRIDLLCALFHTSVALIYTFIGRDLERSADLIGQSLSNCSELLGLVQWAIQQSSQAENLMTSTERLFEYANLAPDEDLRASKALALPPNWPTQGRIQLSGMNLCYPGKSEPVLRNLSLEIKSEEKVALVGRTGAGKSTLTYAFFRLFEPSPAGSIRIDGVDISSISKKSLRNAISIIPQEPVIFRNTIRFNLDPLGLSTDNQIWNAVDTAQLREIIDSFSLGLDSFLDMGGKEFSAGEKQLLCLARAIIANKKIVIMDEATANVDLLTSQQMQEATRKAFLHNTVCTVAHRLHTVIDYDKIVFLANGGVREVGHPHELLERKGSAFGKMVKELGEESEEILREAAREAYLQRSGSC